MERPVASNPAAVAQPFPQPPGTFAAQLMPMPSSTGQPSKSQISASRITNQQATSEQQFVQFGVPMNHSVDRGTGSQTSGKVPSSDSVGVKNIKSETRERLSEKEHKVTTEGINNVAQEESVDKGADAEVNLVKDGNKKNVKEEGSNDNLGPSPGGQSGETAKVSGNDTAAESKLVGSSLEQTEVRVRQRKDGPSVGVQEKNLSRGQVASEGSAVDDFGGFMHSTQLVVPSDQGRDQLPSMPYGLSSQQQRPFAPSILSSGTLSGPPSYALVPGKGSTQLMPHAPDQLPLPGQSLNPSEHLQQPGAFQDTPFGRAPTTGLRVTNQFGHHSHGSFENQPYASQEHYNRGALPPSQPEFPRTSQANSAVGLAPGAGHPGSFDSQSRVMGRTQLHGLEGQPAFNPVKTEIFQNPHHFDGKHADFSGPGSLDRGQFVQTSGSQSNLSSVNGVPGLISTSTSGLPNERFKTVEEEMHDPFPSGQTRRSDQGGCEEVRNQLLSKPSNLPPPEYNYGAGMKMDHGGGAPSRFFPPHHNAGTFHHNDTQERQSQTGHDPEFLGSGTGYGRREMNQLTTKSSGGEYHGIPPRGFGSFQGGPLGLSAGGAIDGRDTHRFGEGPRSFNWSSDTVDNSFRDGRFPGMPGQVRRGEFDGHGNFGMSEQFRNGEVIGQDFVPNHSSRGEFLGPRNVSMRVGDDLRAFSASRMRERPGAGGFPVGEPLGGNQSSHPRLGEHGFRSSYSLSGFPADGDFYEVSFVNLCASCDV